MTNTSIFLLDNKLPTNYDAVIFNVSTQPKTDKMQKCISIYANALIRQWTKDTQ